MGEAGEKPRSDDLELPELHRLAIEALPANMITIMFDCIQNGISKDEMDRRIKAAGKTQIQQN